MDVDAVGEHRVDRVGELLVGRVLDDVALRAELEGLARVGRLVLHREDHDARAARAQLGDRVEPRPVAQRRGRARRRRVAAGRRARAPRAPRRPRRRPRSARSPRARAARRCARSGGRRRAGRGSRGPDAHLEANTRSAAGRALEVDAAAPPCARARSCPRCRGPCCRGRSPCPSSSTVTTSWSPRIAAVTPTLLRLGVPHDVAERLLHDAVDGRGDVGRQLIEARRRARREPRGRCGAPTVSHSRSSAGPSPKSSSTFGRRSAIRSRTSSIAAETPSRASLSCARCPSSASSRSSRRSAKSTEVRPPAVRSWRSWASRRRSRSCVSITRDSVSRRGLRVGLRSGAAARAPRRALARARASARCAWRSRRTWPSTASSSWSSLRTSAPSSRSAARSTATGSSPTSTGCAITSCPARRLADRERAECAVVSRPSTWMETPASSTEPANESSSGTRRGVEGLGAGPFGDLVADHPGELVGHADGDEAHAQQPHGLAGDEPQRLQQVVLVQDGAAAPSARRAPRRRAAPARPARSRPGTGARSRSRRRPSRPAAARRARPRRVNSPSRASVR